MLHLNWRRLPTVIALGVLAIITTGQVQGKVTQIRVGVLAYGTVNWEHNTLKHHGLAQKEGVELVVTK